MTLKDDRAMKSGITREREFHMEYLSYSGDYARQYISD